jgi:hypothetical protein
MQNLTGISSGKNNKSCGIFHHEPNKISFAFFWFFYDFLHNLQEIGKSLLLFELPFRSEALGKILGFATWPLGVAGAAPAEFRPGPAAGPVGEGRGAA